MMTMKAMVMVVIIMKTYEVFSMSYGLLNTDYLILKQLYHYIMIPVLLVWNKEAQRS